MTSQVALTALSSLVSLLGLAYLVLWRYREYRVDLFRQEMFALRDDFFDFASEGDLDFDHPAYGLLRSTMNGYIRFGHRLTMWHGVFLKLFIKKQWVESSFEGAWVKSTLDLDDATRERLTTYRTQMEFLAFKHALVVTPEFFLLILILLICTLVGTVMKPPKSINSKDQRLFDTWGRLRRSFKGIDDAAMIYGQEVEAAA